MEDLIIDGTEIPIQRPDNQKGQQGYYSGKKRHTVKMLMMSDSKKRILYVGKLWSGSIHDITIFKNEFSWINFRGKRTHVDLDFKVLKVSYVTHGL
ncbi:MAG: transposase family protein [Bacteroidia bacterium]|nr:transposase family protein [Bacteroidia bacterium]